jgi:hypothetical protein
MANKKYIVQSDNGGNPYWLAGWSGDPGRTLIMESAKQFNSELSAKKAIKKAIKDNPHRNLEGNLRCVSIE